MCGVVGIISQNRPAAAELYDSLIHLQHRGQDAAGIITADTRFHTKKGVGLVRDIFDEQNMARLLGLAGLGHTRYPTAGGYDRENAQPVWTGVPYGIAMAHNGNLVNYTELVKELSEKDLRHLNATVDVEVILHVFAGALEKQNHDESSFFEKICQAVDEVFERISGAYSVVSVIIGKGMVVFRDPHGIRPLAKGMRINSDGTKDYIFSSETTMFYALGFQQFGFVHPGEVIYISPEGGVQSKILRKEEFSPCIFEYVYFSRPDTMVNDISVYRSRLHMGENLARRWKERYPDIIPDIVIPAPSTANTAALSAAHFLGVRYSEGLYKNPFIGRTFIMPGQTQRKRSIKYKLVPQELEIRDKKVMIVDDSIVRGNTSREIVRMVRDFGARAVYFVSACPPVISPCFYGVDMPSRGELIASQKTVEEIRQFMNVDVLLYQDIQDLKEAVLRKSNHAIESPCMACLDGHYVTGDITIEKMRDLEHQRNQERKA
ncbi:MAG: amidophosphoribosyltransferase [FCB group bacterium]|nr:amidophosphoribosyltransferase [FCB group bacterium]